MRGPIDYIIVGFTEDKFDGGIVRELTKAVESGAIAVLDVALVMRDEYGDVRTLELQDEAMAELIGNAAGRQRLIGDDDITEVGDLLEDGTAAGFLVVEQLWAKGLKKAIIDAGGVLLNEGRIHPDASKELDQEGDA